MASSRAASRELTLSVQFCFCCSYFEMETRTPRYSQNHYVTKDSLELVTLQSLSPECWDDRCVPSHLVRLELGIKGGTVCAKTSEAPRTKLQLLILKMCLSLKSKNTKVLSPRKQVTFSLILCSFTFLWFGV